MYKALFATSASKTMNRQQYKHEVGLCATRRNRGSEDELLLCSQTPSASVEENI